VIEVVHHSNAGQAKPQHFNNSLLLPSHLGGSIEKGEKEEM